MKQEWILFLKKLRSYDPGCTDNEFEAFCYSIELDWSQLRQLDPEGKTAFLQKLEQNGIHPDIADELRAIEQDQAETAAKREHYIQQIETCSEAYIRLRLQYQALEEALELAREKKQAHSLQYVMAKERCLKAQAALLRRQELVQQCRKQWQAKQSDADAASSAAPKE